MADAKDAKPGGDNSLESLLTNKGIISTEKFKGDADPSVPGVLFKPWEYAMRVNIGNKDRELADIMEKTGKAHKMTPSELESLVDGIGTKRDTQLHSILLGMVAMDSEPFKILQNYHGRGLECWPIFQKRWNRTTPMGSTDVAERIREITRATSASEVYGKLQDHSKLVQEWISHREELSYPNVDWKADYLKMIPKEWEREIKLDTTLDYELCTPDALLAKIERFILIHTSGNGTNGTSPIKKAVGAVDQHTEAQAGGGDCGSCGEGLAVDAINPNIQCYFC